MQDTEFACEVVRVTEVLPHPNADRLEIVHFEASDGPTAYTVVDGKGHRRVGDLAAYLSVDCVVPLEGPMSAPFAFLKERIDGKNKAVFRVRAARLRGVYSEGLLLDCPEGAVLGDDLAERLGVTYHNPQPRQAPGGPTAPQLLMRRDWRRTAFPDFTVVSLRKAPFLFGDDDLVTITEKVHGTNFRFGWLRAPGWFGGWHWVVGSHRTYKTDNRPWWKRLLRPSGRRHPGWYGEDVWMSAADAHDLKERCWDTRGIGWYGELFGFTPSGACIQDLTYGPHSDSGTRLVVFDGCHQGGAPVHNNELGLFCADTGLDRAPVLRYGQYPGLDTVREMAEGGTLLSAKLSYDQIREGVVVRSLDGARCGKWVGEGYRLRKNQE